MPSDEAHEVINLTDDIVPPRGAGIEVHAWPEQGKDAATLTLDGAHGTLADFEAKLREKGYPNFRVRQLSGAPLEGCIRGSVTRNSFIWEGGMRHEVQTSEERVSKEDRNEATGKVTQ